eukprot:TRINITY_DN17985_c0_g4_i1.p1 TRINITY_DN17985_c0_g4~~TRINITY_DN17985_c0_g4_i1.p1  ORF type:complete len:239 (+),score=31.21 TRINITY_DN17985_c0_g4_i1:83-799(+)
MGATYGCGVEQSLPCCAKNTSTTGSDIVKARPMSYPEQDPAFRNELLWPGALQGTGAESEDGKGGSSGQNKAATSSTYQEPVEGEENYEDGSAYAGQLLNGRRHGYGTWTSIAEKYTGSWIADQRDGKGKQTWQDGRTYEGSFMAGKFHGQGCMRWETPEGLMMYEGEYVSDMKHGFGKYVWPDNRVYEGEWREGQRCGKARYTNAQGQSRLGIWKSDKVERWLEPPPAAAKGSGTQS